MEKTTILAIIVAILLVFGAVFAAADFLEEGKEGSGPEETAPKACGPGDDCRAGCGGQCGGTCGVPSCGCGR